MYISDEHAPTLHMHYFKMSRDCDGLYENGHIATFRESKLAEMGFKPHTWMNEEVGDMMHMYESDNTGIITQLAPYKFCFEAKTDEGFESAEIEFCIDTDCNPDETHYRDHSAEAMGY